MMEKINAQEFRSWHPSREPPSPGGLEIVLSLPQLCHHCTRRSEQDHTSPREFRGQKCDARRLITLKSTPRISRPTDATKIDMKTTKSKGLGMKPRKGLPGNGEIIQATRRQPRLRPIKKAITPNIISIRGTTEWRDWLDRFAAHQRITPTALVDQALTEAARRAGFDDPPPRC
jgi:hypothetical protein